MLWHSRFLQSFAKAAVEKSSQGPETLTRYAGS